MVQIHQAQAITPIPELLHHKPGQMSLRMIRSSTRPEYALLLCRLFDDCVDLDEDNDGIMIVKIGM